MTLRTSNQTLGQRYRHQTMYLLARLGYATTKQIAFAIFRDRSLSSRKMARRTIRWLLQNGYVVERRDDVNSDRLIALTRAGVSAIAEFMPLPGNREHARDWLRHAHSHRTSCNNVYTAYTELNNFDVGWTELEIRSGDAPANLSLFKYHINGEEYQKIPDVLLESCNKLPIWVEVENSWRSEKDLQKVIGFLRAMFSTPQPQAEGAWFVITSPGAKTIGSRLRTALTHGPESGYGRQVRELDAKILSEKVRIYQLNGETLELARLPL